MRDEGTLVGGGSDGGGFGERRLKSGVNGFKVLLG